MFDFPQIPLWCSGAEFAENQDFQNGQRPGWIERETMKQVGKAGDGRGLLLEMKGNAEDAQKRRSQLITIKCP